MSECHVCGDGIDADQRLCRDCLVRGIRLLAADGHRLGTTLPDDYRRDAA